MDISTSAAATTGDAFSSSTSPLAWHDFLERMRHPSAADFVKSIKSFIVSFSNKAPDPEKDSAAVQEFLANMEGAFRAHTLWAGSTEEELESAGEGLEKYVMTKLYNRAFASFPEDVKRDEDLFEKISLVQKFIRPENLDIKPTFQNETSWLLAQKELQKINMYKAPRDKLVYEFLPVLIYVTIKANPPQLHSNLLYIQQYRRQSRLVSEAAYFFTNILSAESFIWNIDAQSLSMDEADFQRNMESARAPLLDLSGNSVSQGNQINEESMEHKIEVTQTKRDINSSLREHALTRQKYDLNKDHDVKDQPVSNRSSVSDLEKHGASDLLKEDKLSRYFLDYPFLYAHAGDLTPEDVENLLNSYKQLVLKYVSLYKGTGIGSSSLSMPTIQKERVNESTVDSRESEGVVINNEKDEGLTNSQSNEKFEGLTNNQSNESTVESRDSADVVIYNEMNEGLTNNVSSDSLFTGLDDSKPKLPEDDSVSRLFVKKNEIFE